MRLNALSAVVAVNLAAAAALVVLWSDADRSRWSEPEAMLPSLEDVVATPVSEPADVSPYRETLERPLFASSRRIAPRRDPAAEGQEAVDFLKDVRLIGTYGAGSRGGIIVVRGGKAERVPVGASIGDWKVAGEEGRGAALVRANGERRKLELALNTVAPSAPAAASKAGEQDAAKAPAADRSGAADAAQPPMSEAARPRSGEPAQPRPSRPASTERAGTSGSDSAFETRRRERLERFNARRAEKGLPPLTPQN
jgi:Tfp pilus assembly protein PilP